MSADRDPAEGLVREALAALPATRTLAQAPLHRVRGGLSNHAWRADSGGRRYFVRLSGPDGECLGVDRKSECALVRAAASAAFAPAVLACEPSRGLLVMDFVSARPWRREESHRLRNLRRLGQVLRGLAEIHWHAGGERHGSGGRAGR